MDKMIKYLKTWGIFFGLMIIVSLVSTLLNYFTNVSLGFICTLNMIALLIIFFIIGFKQGKVSSSKGWLCGLKNGGILCLFLLLVSLIFFTKNIKLSTFLYYGILILGTVFGSIIGINKKKEA